MTLKDALEKIGNLNHETLEGIEGCFSFRINGGDPEEFAVVIASGRAEILLNGEKSDCLVETDIETFRDVLEGSISPLSAFMSGRIKISGDLSHAMKLSKLLGGV
ncbi:MAG: SCP2 sterol-binding domain-containing protein [Mesotoga sp.]|nr:SCP2 sterol-binding domain-containing protein [Mesotoga sp.]